MAYSATFPYSGSNDLYIKPVTPGSTPSSTPSWGTDAGTPVSPENGAVAFTGLTDGQVYWVYELLGGSPAITDPLLGELAQSELSSLSEILTEVKRIPRASTELVAGGNFTRNKVAISENEFTENHG